MHVVLYSRAGCHLCDEARAVLLAEQARSPFELEEIDIEGSDDLLREYGVRVPVVEVDGVEAFEYTVDPGELAELVRDGPSSL
jgi:glutaredoxin